MMPCRIINQTLEAEDYCKDLKYSTVIILHHQCHHVCQVQCMLLFIHPKRGWYFHV